MSFCIELFCVVTLQYQILVRIAIAYFIIEKKKAAPQPWQAIAQRFCSIGTYGGKLFMKKFRTVASVIIMVIAGIVGFFIGAFLNEPMAGTILFSMIAGIACIVYAIDNHEE